MKKFRFTLRSVETVRGLRELRAREAFTAAVRAVRAADAAKVAAREQRERFEVRLVAARRDLRVIENLKAKARETHRLECEREEQSAMDDRTNAMANHAPLLTS